MNSKNTIKIPNYTKGEEVFNMVTHIVGGAGIGITATVLCVIFAALHSNPWAVVGSAVYGAMIIVLYTMSSIYHGLSPRLTAKKVFRVIDHCSIFLLIDMGIDPADPTVVYHSVFDIIYFVGVIKYRRIDGNRGIVCISKMQFIITN